MAKTHAAQVAKLVRATLKETFPGTKFSVTVSDPRGLGSIQIYHVNVPPNPTVEEVYAAVEQFRAGHFDGETDGYIFKQKTATPTVKYIFVARASNL